LDPILTGSKPTEGDKYLTATKNRSSPFFGGEVKPSAPCRKSLRHVENRSKYERDTSEGKISFPLLQFLLL
jgi:hypothetical protein